MKRFGFTSFICLALTVSSCATGWVDRETKMRIRGKVLERGKGTPIAGAYVDIADNDEMLRLTIRPNNLTGDDGTFDAIYLHDYDRNIFMFIPIGGEPEIPEELLIEVTKDGYAPAILHLNPLELERDSHRAYLVGDVELHKE